MGAGTSGNPAGRPRGARNKLSSEIIEAFSDDFSAHGAEVIERVRTEEPGTYLQIVARLIPREFQIVEESQGFESLTKEELVDAIAAVRQAIALKKEEEERNAQAIDAIAERKKADN